MRRRKTDPEVAPELPDKVFSDRFVQLTGEQAALYKAATAETMARIQASTGIARRGQVLRLLQSLRQICNSPAHFLRQPADGWDADVEAARSGKLQTLEELMDAVTSAGEAALIFTGYVSMGHLIRAHLLARGVTAKFLHGGTPTAQRQEIVDRFQSGHGHALILSVRAAGTGLNLTRAEHVIHFDRPWNPAVEDQATDRAHRIGQHRTVNVHHLIAEGTVEDRISALLARKRELTEVVLASGESALTELDDGELRALVSLSQDLGSGGAA
jgi:SNF2 family DNA or RNA helicase